MGYCYISGRKVRGRWRFDKCDGRQSIDDCSNGGGDPSNVCDRARCNQCVTYCKSYSEAVDALTDWLKLHPGEE